MYLHSFDNTVDLTRTLTEKLTSILRDRLAQPGCASLCVAGGGTPLPLYRSLAECELPWDRIQLTLTDERWAVSDYGYTNESQIKPVFSGCIDRGMQFVSLLTEDEHPRHAVKTIRGRLEKITTPFDIVILGMGNDGHFASLFPQSNGLVEALDLNNANPCAAIEPARLPENAPYSRISLTLSALVSTRNLILLITGMQKLHLLEQAKNYPDVSTLPVSALIQQTQTPLEVYWAR